MPRTIFGLRLQRRAPAPGGPDDPATQRRLALGARSVADLIAPAAIEVARDHVRLDHQYARALAVTAYPRTVTPGWLRPLVDHEEPVELSQHIEPLETAHVVRNLGQQMVRLHSSRLLAARGGRIADPEREVAYEDAERLRDALQRGEERVFSVGLYALLRERSLEALGDATGRVERTLDALLTQSRVALLEQDAGFRTCLPEGQDHLLVRRNLDTSSLATLFPFLSGSLAMERGVLYGIAAHNHSPVILDPFDESLENANAVIFARSGAGKSYFTKLMALRNLLTGVDFLVIDPEDEYRALCAAVGGQDIRLAAGGAAVERRTHLNPFDLPPPADTRDAVGADGGADPLAAQVAALQGLLEVMLADQPGRRLGAYERAVLDRALYETYARAGITADPATHGRPAPLLRDLHAVLAESPSGNDVAGPLAANLWRYVGGSHAGLFAGPTNVDLDGPPFVVFNVQALEAGLRPVGIHLIADFVWRQVRRSRARPRLLIVDEAWSLMQHAEGGAFLASMARRARKYHLGLVTITQDVADFLGSEHGRTVLGNAALKLLMKQDGATIGPVEAAFGLSAEERQLLLGAGKGEGLLCARGARLALRVEASPLEHRLATTAPRELAAAAQPRPPAPPRRRLGTLADSPAPGPDRAWGGDA